MKQRSLVRTDQGVNFIHTAAAMLALLLLLPLSVHAANPSVETILAAIQRMDAAREAAIRDMVYIADTRVLEFEDSSRRSVKSETLSRRRVYLREPDQMRNEFLSMSIDGRELDQREMERELTKQRRGGRRDRNEEFQSPFSPEMAPLYQFDLRGERIFEGQRVWVVDFSPREAGEDRFAGTAHLALNDFQPLHVEMAPSVMPSVLREFSLAIRFAPVQGYQLPSVFSMDMRVRVSFLVTLSDRTLSIEERYSEHQLNVGLEDEVFAE